MRFVLAVLLAFCPVLLSDLRAQETPQKEAEQLDFAQGLLGRGMHDMAQAEFQRFLDEFPQSSRREEAVFGVGESRFLAKDFAKAAESFDGFRQSFPQSTLVASAVLRLAQISIAQGNHDQALKDLGSVDAGSLKGENAQGFAFYQGQALRGKGDMESALKFFQQAAAAADSTVYTAAAFEAMAEIQVKNRHYPEAVEAYTKALPLASDEDSKGFLTYRLGEAQFLAGNYADAIAQFQQVIDKHTKLDVTKDALTNLLLARFNLGQYDYMLAVYKNSASLIKEDPGYFDVHLAVAKAHFQLKQYDEALALIDKILSWPGLTDEAKRKANVAKAEVLVKQAKYQEGIALVRDINPQAGDFKEGAFVQAQSYYGLGDFAKAAESFGSIVNNHPNSSYYKAALLGLAHSLQQAGDAARAGESFLKYYEAAGDDQTAKGEALYSAALMQAKADDKAPAVSSAEKYLKEFPQGAFREATVLLLGNLYAETQQSDKAIALLQEYLTHPDGIQDKSAVYFLLGYNQQRSGKADLALQTYVQVPKVKDAKFYVSALKNSAAIYLERNDPAQAAGIYERLIAELDNGVLEFKTYLWLCNEYLKQKKFQETLRIAQKAQDRFPNESRQELLYFKAEASRGLRDFEQARKLYDQVLAFEGRNTFTGAAHIGKGLDFMAVGKFSEAQAEFQKALDENADDQTITLRARFELANALMAQKKPDEALRFYLLVSTIYEDAVYCPQAMFKAAGILETSGRKPEAVKLYQDIADKYKDSNQAALAREKLAAAGT